MSNNQPLNSSLKKNESKINSNSYNKEEENNEKEIPLRYNNGNEKESNNLNETKNILAQTQEKRLSLNVEDLLIQEDKLYKILDNIRIKVNFNFSAEQYLEFSHITSIQTFVIFFEEKYKENINNAQIYEFISAVFSNFSLFKKLFK